MRGRPVLGLYQALRALPGRAGVARPLQFPRSFSSDPSPLTQTTIDPNLDLYKVLGVPKSADYPKIKAAYLRKAAMWHPDRNTHTADLARRKFEEVKIALDILSDETVRRQYDLKQFESVEDLLKNRPQATRAGY